MNCLDPESNYALFLEIARLHYLKTHRSFQKRGVYPGQPPLLFALYKDDGQSQAELAQSLKIKAPTVTIMLKRMEKSGIVKRVQDEIDQRVMRVYLTEYGRKLCKSIYKEIQCIEERMFSGLSEEEKSMLNRLFKKIRDNLKEPMETNTR
ncbi:MAG: MarR family transcriptional regulator [Tepidanaerobacter acetatoxydans]|jgi:DNA-binding MarR family transcriptional regulator|uniref:MarR family winged helix-turn-helix transcriptional regulator n=1 Tax=Tepidanaerobacter TaxID=499228 RepID=UPI000A972432|nr:MULTISPECIES: MarR family transcriptional regulator [Tepidanaerobacter]NLU11131.1 MarR family transcriptional regulator [Tepidanaerobacter acetatoxydans]